jgi:serine phosphatase RsbU (regulator of sigma subunit)
MSAGAESSAQHRPGRVRATTAAFVVVIIGAVITGASVAVAGTLNARNERGLLDVQARQAAAVLSGTILTITGPLDTALRVAQTTNGSPAAFDATMGRVTGPGRTFISALLWDTGVTPARAVARVGLSPELDPASPAATTFIAHAQQTSTFVVTNPGAELDRVAYADADTSAPRYVIYAERAIPASKVVPVQRSAPFNTLNFATYLGPDITPTALATTNVPVSQLPLTGEVSTQAIAFGDTTLTLVATANGHLGGDLGWKLPWIFLVGGTTLTLVTALAVVSLVRSRRRAEQDGAIIAELYSRVDDLYVEQRGIAETLQKALLPATNPTIPGLEIASRYVAGARGVDVGGDWYSIIRIDEDHVGFVVGDVSGRGISAAAVMARLRFTIRAYLFEGHDPGTVLEMCSRQFDISQDGHFATVLVGVANLRTRDVVLANAGHLPPLVIAGSHSAYVETDSEPPLGTGQRTHATTRFAMPEASTLLAFTDGLVERRSEGLDTGLERLTELGLTAEATLEDFLDLVVDDLTQGGSEDDVALLTFRWRPMPR